MAQIWTLMLYTEAETVRVRTDPLFLEHQET